MEHADFNILYVNSLYTGTLNNVKKHVIFKLYQDASCNK